VATLWIEKEVLRKALKRPADQPLVSLTEKWKSCDLGSFCDPKHVAEALRHSMTTEDIEELKERCSKNLPITNVEFEILAKVGKCDCTSCESSVQQLQGQ